MFRKILFLLPLFLGISSFSLPVQIPIKKLSAEDKNFSKFHSLIAQNKAVWSKMTKSFKPTDIRKIDPLSIALYQTSDRDTVFSVAEKMGLNVDTLISFNSLANSLSLSSGDTLLIPSMDGIIIYPATKIATDKLARIYNIPENLLLYTNSMNSGFVHPKEEVFIPFGRMSDEEKNYFLFQPFSFPLDSGRFSSNYGVRFHPVKRRWLFHGGVDIAVPSGTNVYACAEGKVIYSGAVAGYGNLVVIRHKYGYTSWYGHLSKILVSQGKNISSRERIALSGSTGISTGPHLHFEIRRFNLRENPMEVLTFDHQSATYDTGKEDDTQDSIIETSTD